MSTDLPFLPPSQVPPRQNSETGISPKRRGIPGKNNLNKPLPEHLAKDLLQNNTPVDIHLTYKAKELPATPDSSKSNFIPFLPGPSNNRAPPELPPKDYLSRPLGGLNHELMETPSVFRKPEHFEVFSYVFGVTGVDGRIVNIEEVTSIYVRMVNFAHASDTTADIMVKNLRRGKEVALEIVSPDFKLNHKEYPASDLVALDWFLKAQQAKMKQLYLKGATKFTDPDHLIPQFLLQVRGMYKGKEALAIGPYARASSHRLEETGNIKNSILHCQNGAVICFSKENRDILHATSKYKPKDIHFFDNRALGIETSGEGLNPPGKNSRTYLFHLISEFDEVTGKMQSVIEYKSESYGLPPITADNTWGKPAPLALDTLAHGLNIYKKFTTPDPNALFPSLKEDKLPPKVRNLLRDLPILKGEQEPLLTSYEELQLSSQLGNDYGLPQLRAHLMNQRHVPLPAHQKKQIEALLLEIEKVNQKSRDIQEGSKHIILPRGQEVILPTLGEMLENKVKFMT